MKRYLLFTCLILALLALVACAPGAGSEPGVASSGETPLPATATPTPTSAPGETVVAVPTAAPIEMTTPTATPIAAAVDPTPVPPPALPREAVDNLTAVSAQAIAYLQEGTLFIRALPDGQPVVVESCPEGSTCIQRYFKWSPDGSQLLFFSYTRSDDGAVAALKVADRQGAVQLVSDDVRDFQPGAWSPDGRAIAFMSATDTYTEGSETQPGGRQIDVWTAAVDEAGVVGAPQAAGSWLQVGDGCGGGGRSASEVLYENEGGTSYGYLMGVLEWSAADVLLFTRDCTNIGIGRYDLAAQTALPDFAQPLRNLVLNNARDRWYAVTGYSWTTDPGNNELVTGTPDAVEVTVIPTSAPVELVFVGPVSGALYYTERTPLGRDEVLDRGMYFAYFQSALWRLQPDGSGEAVLWGDADDHAYAQVTETAVGDVLMVVVENEAALFAAAQDASLDDAALQAFMPQRRIVLLPAAGGEPQVVLSNAGQPALAR
ncbi:MAG: PD40 domain-containing protein [Anaerolineales bacterium]|nr:PD40 domain-containing protein [Anaerolineales bacterium]